MSSESGAQRRSLARRLLPAVLAALAVTAPATANADSATLACIAAADRALDLRAHGKLLDARRAAAECAIETCGADIKEACEQRVRDINVALPRITFAVKNGAGEDLSGVTLMIDGVAQPGSLDGRALTVDPGRHLFVFEHEGQAPVEKELILRENEKDRTETVLVVAPLGAPSTPPPVSPGSSPPVADAAPDAWSNQKTLALVAGGIGLAGIGSGTYFGLTAASKWSAAQRDCGRACGAGSLGQTEKTDADGAATLSTVAFGFGAAGLLGGAALWFTAPTRVAAPRSSARVTVVPSVGARGGMLTMAGDL